MANQKKGKERRRRYRVKVRLPLIIKTDKENILTYTTNLSLLGGYLESSEKIEPTNKKYEFIIEITPSRHIKCSGVIMKCEARVKDTFLKRSYYHINVFFSNFLNNGENRLADYLEDVIARQKKVLDRWIKKRKTKNKLSDSRKQSKDKKPNRRS